MKTTTAVLAAVGLTVTLGGIWWFTNEPPQTPTVSAAKTDGAARCRLSPGYAVSYAYQSSVDATIQVQGMSQPMHTTTNVSATLALEVLSTNDGQAIVLAQLLGANDEFVRMHGEKIAAPFLVAIGGDCELKRFARAKTTPLKAAQAQQVAMFDLFFKVPTAASEQATFENGTGVARAEFANVPGGVTRSIKGYDLAWRNKTTFEVTTSLARVTLNEHWLEGFESIEGISGGLLVNARVSSSLKRELEKVTAVAPTASRNESEYEWSNLLSGSFASGAGQNAASSVPLAEQRFVTQMKDQTIESSFSMLLERVEAKVNIEDQWHEMTGFLNGHPEQIEAFAEGLKDDSFPEDAKAVSYLVLSKVSDPRAREALSSLRREEKMSPGDRMRASLALVTRQDVGGETARELRQDALAASTGTAEGDFLPRNSLLHLGVLGALHKSDAEAYAVARDTVKGALQSAGDDVYSLSPALGAAGNLGDATLFSTLEAYSRHSDVEVRALVPKSLRGYGYVETEKLWVEWLRRETSPDVKEKMFDVIYHQLANGQRKAGREVAAEAMRHLRMKPMVLARQSIIHVLGPLKNEMPEAKSLLIEQLAEEFRNKSGLYSQIANYLAPAEIELGLASMPEFAHQYGAQGRAAAAAAVRQLEAEQAKQLPQDVSLAGGE